MGQSDHIICGLDDEGEGWQVSPTNRYLGCLGNAFSNPQRFKAILEGEASTLCPLENSANPLKSSN